MLQAISWLSLLGRTPQKPKTANTLSGCRSKRALTLDLDASTVIALACPTWEVNPMPGKMTWLKAGKVDVHVGVGQKKLRIKMVFPEDVTRRLLVQLRRKLT
jgi:hypothetical protein